MPIELTTVTDHSVIAHSHDEDSPGPGEVITVDDLEPNAELTVDGLGSVRTLARPGGELLATVCTVNDVHFGEREVGNLNDEADFAGVVLTSAPDETPYVDLMNTAAVSEMAALKPDAVIVKGDLTCRGTLDEFEEFVACYKPLAANLTYVRGNHDAYGGEAYADSSHQAVLVPGLLLAVLDTTIPGETPGAVTDDQIDWLDSLAAKSDRPVLVLGHHPVAWGPSDTFNLSPESSDRLIEVIDRRTSIISYSGGHTHRNYVTHTPAGVPLTEVSSVKDFPGGWTQYRVFEGGVVQSFHRVSSAEALTWTNRTRALFDGVYGAYSFGSLHDRCLVLPTR